MRPKVSGPAPDPIDLRSADKIYLQTFSSADYAFLFSFAQKFRETAKKSISIGVNAKIIYRKVGHFATAWGLGLDAGMQMQSGKWQAGIFAKDITTTFNAW